MKDNITLLQEVANSLNNDFKDANLLRTRKSFKDKDRQYFMTRCKQAEGIISATKNSLENQKYADKISSTVSKESR